MFTACQAPGRPAIAGSWAYEPDPAGRVRLMQRDGQLSGRPRACPTDLSVESGPRRFSLKGCDRKAQGDALGRRPRRFTQPCRGEMAAGHRLLTPFSFDTRTTSSGFVSLPRMANMHSRRSVEIRILRLQRSRGM